MSNSKSNHISLEQAKSLVKHLEMGEQKKADEIIRQIQSPVNTELFAEIGKLTRQLHDSMQAFHVDSKINDLANADIPDAKERLNYVIKRTEEAANKTMDVVESVFPVIDSIQKQISVVTPDWDKLMNNNIDLKQFKFLCSNLDSLIKITDKESKNINSLMTDVLMAQDFQDLTGQVIRKVIDLVIEVEESLISMLTMFGLADTIGQNKKPSFGENLVEGPIINTEERDDIVEDQDDVDDLLSSLGF